MSRMNATCAARARTGFRKGAIGIFPSPALRERRPFLGL
jgi:hypothetical protein